MAGFFRAGNLAAFRRAPGARKKRPAARRSFRASGRVVRGRSPCCCRLQCCGIGRKRRLALARSPWRFAPRDARVAASAPPTQIVAPRCRPPAPTRICALPLGASRPGRPPNVLAFAPIPFALRAGGRSRCGLRTANANRCAALSAASADSHLRAPPWRFAPGAPARCSRRSTSSRSLPCQSPSTKPAWRLASTARSRR